MSSPLKGPDGRPIAPTLTTIAPINHCGDCHFAVLMAQADGTLDINLLTCIESPPQIAYIPIFKPGPAVAAPQVPGGRMPGPPVYLGAQKMCEYPSVSRTMRACHRFQKQTDQDKAVHQIEEELRKSDTDPGEQAKN